MNHSTEITEKKKRAFSFLPYHSKFCHLLIGDGGGGGGGVLTLAQTTNLRLSQTERVCRRQF